jgi:hypothetical protein
MNGALADEVEHWRSEAYKLANILMSSYTWVHEYKIEEVDKVLAPYIGKEYDAATESSSTS